jgi:hypothetical protein
MKKNCLTLLLLQLAFLVQLHAQKPEVKFGKVNEDDLKMAVYAADSSAHAVILYDYGETNFRYDVTGDKGWQLEFERTVRIKVLDKEGVSAGDFHIRLYHDGSTSKEKINDIDGITFNLENGKITKTKLENKNVMQKDEDKFHVGYTFAMPDVREGSVIDVRYKIESDFIFNLQPWRFQYDIPVQWSEYLVSIPEYFIYNHTMLGYNSLFISEITDTRANLVFTTKSRSDGYVTKTSYEQETVEYIVKRHNVAMKNVPAFEEEDYLTTPDNYLSTYSFELASTKSSDNVYKDYTRTWEKVNELMLEDEQFGRAIHQKGFITDAVELKTSGMTSEKEKTLAILDLIKKKVRWNGYNAVDADDIKKAWNDGSGSSGEINLILINALRSAKINTTPVVLSTRKNGFLNPVHPSISDFNYVVACVVTDGDTMLVDVTEPLAPAGLLPERCLNDKGRLISESNPGWMSLKPKASDKHSCTYTFTLDAEGSVIGQAKHIRDGYNALRFRKDVASAASVDEFYKQKAKNITNLEFTSTLIPTLDSIYKPVEENAEFTIADAVDMNSELILINPMMFEATTSNPFKLKERVYPVEFSYPTAETIISNWVLPEGYVIDQIPKPIALALPGNSGKFTYNVTQLGNNVMITSIIKINQTTFVHDEYAYLKEFFNQIIAKQAENIVIKKL